MLGKNMASVCSGYGSFWQKIFDHGNLLTMIIF